LPATGNYSAEWYHFDIKILLSWKAQAIMGIEVCLTAFENAGAFIAPGEREASAGLRERSARA